MGVARKWLRGFVVVTTALVIATGCLAWAPRIEHESGSASANADAEAVLSRVAMGVAAATSAIDTIWPGAWPADRRIVLGVEGERSMVVGPRPIDYEGRVYSAGRRLGAPPELHATIWDVPDITMHVRFDFDVPLGSESVFGSTVIPAVTHFDDAEMATTVFLFHEYFHWFQFRQFAEADVDVDAMFAAMANARVPSEASAERQRAAERTLLRSAVLASSAEEGLKHLAAYYQQVDQRLPRVLRVGEEVAERLEGTANYFSYVATAITLQLPGEAVVEFIVRDLERTFPEDVGRGAEGLRNWHMYAAGAAKSMLLNRFVDDWQSKIATGHTLDELLLELLR